MATEFLKKDGYGQVELNHNSGIVEGHIYAQYPADTAELGEVLEQGRFVCYDGTKKLAKSNYVGAVTKPQADKPVYMIYNEEQFWDERKTAHKDYAMKAEDYIDGEIVPRLIEVCVGDIHTTNLVKVAEGDEEKEVTVGTVLTIDDDGYLSVEGTRAEEFTVINSFSTKTTMPDGQTAVKVQRTK